jgi:hypothetical protein
MENHIFGINPTMLRQQQLLGFKEAGGWRPIDRFELPFFITFGS